MAGNPPAVTRHSNGYIIWTKELRAWGRHEWEIGTPVSAIASHLGADDTVVRNAAGYYGWHRPKVEPPVAGAVDLENPPPVARNHNDQVVWTADLLQWLSLAWDAGLITAEIGRRLGVSKNRIVGKARRLGLDPRPSPILPPAEPKQPPIVCPERTLPPLPSEQHSSVRMRVIPMIKDGRSDKAIAAALHVSHETIRALRNEINGLPAEVPVIRSERQIEFLVIDGAPVIARPEPVRGPRTCAAVEPGERRFQWVACPAAALPGKQYCEACYARYVRPQRVAA